MCSYFLTLVVTTAFLLYVCSTQAGIPGACCSQTQQDRATTVDERDISMLQACLDDYVDHREPFNFAIMTMALPNTGSFSITNITHFSTYQRAILASYAEVNGYTFKWFNSTTGLDFENTNDSRWFKIKLLLDAVSPGGWAEKSNFVVWIG